MTAQAIRLGDILVEHGAIARDALERHSAAARGRIGDYLRSHGHITGHTLARAVAAQQELEHVDFARSKPDAALFRPREFGYYIAHQFIPFARDGATLVIATSQPTEKLRARLTDFYGGEVRFVVTASRDLAAYFASTGAQAASRRARLSLRRRNPMLVAARTLAPQQKRGFLLFFALIAGGFIFAPAMAWHAVLVACNFFYLATLAIKIQLYVQGRAGQRAIEASEPELRERAHALDTHQLPVYTILVPLYQESVDVMRRLIINLNQLDYPREKLDIKLICEADDDATIGALKSLQPPETMEIIRVPPSTPRTKPKACNVALQHIRGEFLVIFDAEDAPAPDQLKRAVVMFAAGGAKLACVQAPLNYYNRDENLLTQLFSIEYSALFTILLPALQRMKLPIPLGGTSNHLRVAPLQAAGGWDAFNVTEDADLGIRLAYFGYETCMLPSLTLEEAPISLNAWIKQRTRWIKGYIQTWLVYTRDRRELKRRLGGPGYYGFQFFVGAPAVTFLLAPLFWAIFILSLTGLRPAHLSPLMLSFCLISFLGGLASHLLFARAVLARERWHHMRLALLAYPFYWMLHSIAAARALYQLAFDPHRWEKTKHGVSTIFR